MLKNSGDTQARFLAKSLAVLFEQSAISIQPKKLARKGRKGRKESQGTGFRQGDGTVVRELIRNGNSGS